MKEGTTGRKEKKGHKGHESPIADQRSENDVGCIFFSDFSALSSSQARHTQQVPATYEQREDAAFPFNAPLLKKR